MKSPSPSPHVLIFGVQATWESLVALALELALAAWYLRAVSRERAQGRPWPWTKTLLWLAGLVVAAYTVEGGIAHYSQSNFTLNVTRCLLLFDLVPPLLCLGSPFMLAVSSSTGRARQRVVKVLSSPVARCLGHPVVAIGVAMGSLYLYFLTPLYRLSQEHGALGGYVGLHLVLVGCLMWWPIVGADLGPWPLNFVPRFAMVFATLPFNIALGVAVGSWGHPLYPAGNTLFDTQTGGDVLWEVPVVYTVLVLALLFVSWAYDEERRAVSSDLSRAGAGPGEPGERLG